MQHTIAADDEGLRPEAEAEAELNWPAKLLLSLSVWDGLEVTLW